MKKTESRSSIVLRHVATLAAAAIVSVSPLHAAPPELFALGNKLVVKATGAPVRLVGVNVVSLDWGYGENVTAAITESINNWKSNVIRLPVDQALWLGANGAAYKSVVDTAINQISVANKYVVLDLHGGGLPNTGASTFWTDAATRYKNNPAVLFGLFNEVSGTTSVPLWRNGDATHPGMQTLLNVVRATGAKNIVVVGGLDYAYNDDIIIDHATGTANAYALTESTGNGIMYDAHIYPWKSNWAYRVGTVANLYPVLVGEIGHPGEITYVGIPNSFEAHGTWVPKALDFIDTLNLNWTGWAFHPGADPGGLPSMITSWTGFPTTAWWGAPAKSRLISYLTPTTSHVIGGTVITGSQDMVSRYDLSRGAVMTFGAYNYLFRSNLATGGWVGLDLGKPHRITRIDYMPPALNGVKMVGGVFQASNTANFSSGVVTLNTITVAPTHTGGVFTSATITNTGLYRYIRYVGPANQYSTVDELKFFGRL